eukprot:364326-Chlamydomonas_euryale.AAC.3
MAATACMPTSRPSTRGGCRVTKVVAPSAALNPADSYTLRILQPCGLFHPADPYTLRIPTLCGFLHPVDPYMLGFIHPPHLPCPHPCNVTHTQCHKHVAGARDDVILHEPRRHATQNGEVKAPRVEAAVVEQVLALHLGVGPAAASRVRMCGSAHVRVVGGGEGRRGRQTGSARRAGLQHPLLRCGWLRVSVSARPPFSFSLPGRRLLPAQ